MRDVTQGPPLEQIAFKAADQIRIFMASHGRRGLLRIIVGSVTQIVLSRSKIPVVVYHRTAAGEDATTLNVSYQVVSV
jgi:nucleotide-binding universal stress UspA family protein